MLNKEGKVDGGEANSSGSNGGNFNGQGHTDSDSLWGTENDNCSSDHTSHSASTDNDNCLSDHTSHSASHH